MAHDLALRIDPARYWNTVMRSGQIGPGKAGGLRRLALTDADKEMRDLFVMWCTEAGCTVAVDRVGNIFARRPGVDDHLPPVVIGSHLDTQFAAGKYDGIVGVLAGLEILRTLDDGRVPTKRPLEVVCWTNEEGARFTPPMVASGTFASVFDVDWVLALRDDDGKGFGAELERIGYAGKEAVGGRGLDAYFELHIEQGPILERESIPVGVVVGGYAVRGMHVDIHGETAHAGPTPMDKRRNALIGASMLAVAVNDVGWKYHATEGKATVPRIVAWPNKAGILAEYAQLTCDVRHADPHVADAMWTEIKTAMPDCARRANVEMTIAGEWKFGSERFDAGCLRLVREAADALGIRHRDILSQAGHDAYYISRVAPTALIFTPCRDGISHNEAEHADLDDTVPGVDVLLHAVLARANRA